MEEVRLTTDEAIRYVLTMVGIGFLLGLIPLVAGIIKRKIRLGVFGLIASMLGALVGFILAIPAMAIFTWLIVRDAHVAEDVASDAPPAASDERN